MERELIMTGIGGQGIQLAAAVVARAALLEGRDVQVFGSYGGMMRGGATESTIVVSDGPVESAPDGGPPGRPSSCTTSTPLPLWPGSGRAACCSSTPPWSTGLDRGRGCTVVEVPAYDMAVTLGNAMAASMVMVGAYAAVTGLVGLASLSAASPASLPSYRTQHAALNERGPPGRVRRR